MGRPIRQETLIDRGAWRSRVPVEAAVLGKPKPPDRWNANPLFALTCARAQL
jgi:hypothetical protein